MKLAFFVGTSAGVLAGLSDRLVRLRLRSHVSHCELVFVPGDGVDALMPDGSCALDAGGAAWCASASGFDEMASWSRRRPGCRGGVRFKRIDLRNTADWLIVDLPWLTPARKLSAARWFCEHEGELYDWRGVFGFLAWPISGKDGRWTCHEACCAALGVTGGDRLDPAALCELALYARNSMREQHYRRVQTEAAS